MASSNIIPCSLVEQVMTNLLSDDHDGDGSQAPQQESYRQCPQSYYVTHSWLTMEIFLYTLT